MGFNSLGEKNEGTGRGVDRGFRVAVLGPALLALMANISCIAGAISTRADATMNQRMMDTTGVPNVPRTGNLKKPKLRSFSALEIRMMSPKILATFDYKDFYNLTYEQARIISENDFQFWALDSTQRGGVLYTLRVGRPE
ncbi:MAG: hypothetical protein WC269_00910 [Candidatus Gracilibacteria bacterium]|jgi:hypothetical protein